jgi:hypothetical protein
VPLRITGITSVCAGDHWEYTVNKTGVGSKTFILHEGDLDSILQGIVTAFPIDLSGFTAGQQADIVTTTIFALWNIKRNGKTKADIIGKWP